MADDAIARMQALAEAGASSVDALRIQVAGKLITAVVGAVAVPVNCTAHPVRHGVACFARMAVG